MALTVELPPEPVGPPTDEVPAAEVEPPNPAIPPSAEVFEVPVVPPAPSTTLFVIEVPLQPASTRERMASFGFRMVFLLVKLCGVFG